MTPNPNATYSLLTAQGHVVTGELHSRKADEATPTQRKLHTQAQPTSQPIMAQDMLHCSTHPTANRSPAPSPGPEPQKEAGRPASPPKRSHIPINTAHCLAKTPSPEPGAPPTTTGDRRQGPRKALDTECSMQLSHKK
ncbi:hypothetical protein ILYODFUR_022812, partial [Ilyodon furcidens]